MDKHGITILYHLHYHEIFRAKVGRGGIKYVNQAVTDKECIETDN